ncbi:MAG: hypothetical protein LC667_04250 [Thioalkalivibrio sp.]|nr:hypothetical protein [Thioalkalivibrio sp.]
MWLLLQLPDGEVIGVTTAHSLPGRTFRPLEFTPPGQPQPAASFSEQLIPPEVQRGSMTEDSALLKFDGIPDSSMVLYPDPRAHPEPGERLDLYSGLGDGSGGRRVHQGTVETVNFDSVWVRMDEPFDPRLMSGSPILGQHTGKVVGVATSMLVAPGPLRIGMNPIRAAIHAAGARRVSSASRPEQERRPDAEEAELDQRDNNPASLRSVHNARSKVFTMTDLRVHDRWNTH